MFFLNHTWTFKNHMWVKQTIPGFLKTTCGFCKKNTPVFSRKYKKPHMAFLNHPWVLKKYGWFLNKQRVVFQHFWKKHMCVKKNIPRFFHFRRWELVFFQKTRWFFSWKKLVFFEVCFFTVFFQWLFFQQFFQNWLMITVQHISFHPFLFSFLNVTWAHRQNFDRIRNESTTTLFCNCFDSCSNDIGCTHD